MIYLQPQGFINIFLTLWAVFRYATIYLLACTVPGLASGGSSRLALSTQASFFQEHCTTFWHHGVFQDHPLFALCQPPNLSLFQKAMVPSVGECPPCFLRAPQSQGCTSLLPGPWIPDFSTCPTSFTLLRVRKVRKGFYLCVSLSAKLLLSHKPAAWSFCGISSSTVISSIRRGLGWRNTAQIY